MTDQARTPTTALVKDAAREVSRINDIRPNIVKQEATKIIGRCVASALLAAEQREQALREALTEALNEWEYASQYKSEHLAKKHGDAERIAELRAALAAPSEPPAPSTTKEG